ncbi:nucleotide exchange factor GrpE [Marinibactrum halimedae]|uniref:Protein GrpE n=1 Tax=Marinibactrum halimedae TaxID=1444977 RepID=A0AA37WM40_9GAMM|nr:nucleotide exchange factor GrpE [Marinibactrum halimedae]MCD9459016.1 nucleotide exchange factor GrpE [Marinibactrum halimedae]GLS26854.1 protein GrpE [Marinibactrum halimedae]
MSNEEQKPQEELDAKAQDPQEAVESVEDVEVEQELGVEEAVDVQALQDEVAELKDQLLRTQAEAQNIRRRAQQDVEKAHKFALEKFAGDMLSVADNLERATASINKDDESLKPVLEGVELTYKTLVDALKRHSVEQVDPAGEPFDPQLHQAMSMIENPDVEPSTVIEVFQKGYTLNGRLVRPAMVVVSKSAG